MAIRRLNPEVPISDVYTMEEIVAERRSELAVRMALEATHGRVIRLVVGEGARLIAFGLLLAIPGIDMAGRAHFKAF